MAGDRLQIVLAAKDEITQELKQVKSEFKSLERTSIALNKRMQAGEQGLQDEYEQTRLQLNKNIDKQQELGRAASKAKTELRELTTDGTAGAKRLDRSFDGVNRTMGKTRSAAGKLSAGWGKMVGVVAGVAGAITAAGFAFRFLGDSIGEAREQRKAVAQLTAVMRSMGRTEAPEAIGRLVDQLSRMSGLEDDEILASVNLMLTFGEVTGKTFKDAERAAVDLSAAFHMDLQSATVMVGKALNNPIGGLTSLMRVGVAFTEQQKEQIKGFMEEGRLAKAQGIIMAELRRQVDGSAKAQADMIDRTRAAWKDFKQTVGDVLMDTVSQLAGMGNVDPAKGLRKASKWIKENRQEIIQTLMQMAGWTLKFAAATARMGEVTLAVYGDLTVMLGGMIKALGWLGKSQSMQDFGQSLIDAGSKADQSSVGMGKLAAKLDALGTNALNAAAGLDATRTSWQTLKEAGVSKKVLDASRNTPLAMGGPVAPNSTHLVGELGPELFVPKIGTPRVIGADGPEIRDFRTSGTVVPNHLLATVTLPKQAQPAGYIGPPVQIGTINATQGVDVENAILRAQMRADRIARERR